jgi:hypothetical protein
MRHRRSVVAASLGGDAVGDADVLSRPLETSIVSSFLHLRLAAIPKNYSAGNCSMSPAMTKVRLDCALLKFLSHMPRHPNLRS